MKPIHGYPGYWISDTGRVFSGAVTRSETRLVELAQVKDRDGYPRVRLVRNGRRSWSKVAKLMALAFLPTKPSPIHQVRHLDGDNANSLLSNLAWGTPQENCADRERHGTTARGSAHGFSKLTEKEVIEIKSCLAAGIHQHVIAERFGIIQAHVSRIKRGVVWAHIKL